jgi:hypothetical protein
MFGYRLPFQVFPRCIVVIAVDMVLHLAVAGRDFPLIDGKPASIRLIVHGTKWNFLRTIMMYSHSLQAEL